MAAADVRLFGGRLQLAARYIQDQARIAGEADGDDLGRGQDDCAGAMPGMGHARADRERLDPGRR